MSVRRLALLAAAAIAPTLLVAPPATSAEPSTWSCYAYADGVNASGTPVGWSYELGKVKTITYGPGKLGFVPRDIAYTHEGGAGGGGGTGTTTTTGYWLALTGSELREVRQTRTFNNSDGSHVSSSYGSRVMSSRWSSVRQISFGSGTTYLYALTGSGINRYKVTGTPGSRTVTTDQVIASSGWAGVRSLAYTGTWSVGGVSSDVFTSVLPSTGALVQYVFPRANPKAWSRKTLKSSGWSSMKVVAPPSYCYDFDAGRQYEGFIGVQTDNDIYRYYDKSPQDFSGADIGGLGRSQVAWAATAYND